MNLKFFIPAVMVFSAVALFGQTPVYLDNSADIEDRIDDVMKRLTTEEKVAMLDERFMRSFPCPFMPRSHME